MSYLAYAILFFVIAVLIVELVTRAQPWGRWSWLWRSLISCAILIALEALALSTWGASGSWGDREFATNLASIAGCPLVVVSSRISSFERRWKEGTL